MLTLLLLSQITREEFLDFRKQAEIQFVRIDDSNFRCFNYIFNFMVDKKLVVKLEEKFKNLEEENKRLRNQNQVLISIIEKIVNGASKEEIMERK
jgi:hypothetical protein